MSAPIANPPDIHIQTDRLPFEKMEDREGKKCYEGHITLTVEGKPVKVKITLLSARELGNEAFERAVEKAQLLAQVFRLGTKTEQISVASDRAITIIRCDDHVTTKLQKNEEYLKEVSFKTPEEVNNYRIKIIRQMERNERINNEVNGEESEEVKEKQRRFHRAKSKLEALNKYLALQ